jgi:hypothetical protein
MRHSLGPGQDRGRPRPRPLARRRADSEACQPEYGMPLAVRKKIVGSNFELSYWEHRKPEAFSVEPGFNGVTFGVTSPFGSRRPGPRAGEPLFRKIDQYSDREKRYQMNGTPQIGNLMGTHPNGGDSSKWSVQVFPLYTRIQIIFLPILSLTCKSRDSNKWMQTLTQSNFVC